MSNKKPDTKIVRRDSGTGEFVTKKYADSHPKTTEKEKVFVPSPDPRKKK
jgi:hypothetical protein